MNSSPIVQLILFGTITLSTVICGIQGINPVSISIAKKQCEMHANGKLSRFKRIINGTRASFGEFPHMAYISSDLGTCRGTLISNNFVLTAAHCIHSNSFNLSISSIIVRLGATVLNGIDDDITMSTQTFSVVAKFIYNESSPPRHDIGLLKLNRSVVSNQFVRPACLSIDIDTKQSPVVATGWGRNEPFRRTSDMHLRKIELSYDTQENCCEEVKLIHRNYTEICALIEMHYISCTTSMSGNLCTGDSGGPLQKQSLEESNSSMEMMSIMMCMTNNSGSQNSKNFYLVGIISFGRRGCQSRIAFYTNVAAYLDWIVENVWTNEPMNDEPERFSPVLILAIIYVLFSCFLIIIYLFYGVWTHYFPQFAYRLT